MGSGCEVVMLPPVLAVTQPADMRALLGGGASGDRLATTHLMAGAVFLVLGGIAQVLALFVVRFGDILPISYGRLETASNLLLMVGFGVISLAGGIYYVLPRLTGARLAAPEVALFGLMAMSAISVVGVIITFVGFGDGVQPLGLPWWLDIPLLGAVSVPAFVTLMTIRQREEKRSFVTLWFVMGGVVWLPLLYLSHLVTELPSVSAITSSYAQLFLSSGYVTMFLITVGSGLGYYTVVKDADVPLASRQLAQVGFWSLGFAGVWWGTAQLLFGPGPDWVAGVAAALGLAFPIGTLANAVNVSLTLEGSWRELGEKPAVQSAVYGLYLAVGISILAAMAGFRTIGSAASLTHFWEAIEFVALTGVGTFLVASVAFGALERGAGRQLETIAKTRTFFRLTLTGSVGLLITLGAAGLLAGYSWIGGSNSGAYADIGEGWAAGLGATHDALLLVAIGFGFVLLLGVLRYATIVLGTVFIGEPIKQEVLVDKVDTDE